MRGIKTLAVRMLAHEKNALAVAKILQDNPKVEKVIFPGLHSHPQYEIGKKQMRGYSGMITFYLKGGIKESRTFLESLKIFTLAESLGGVESLIEHPAIMTHASLPQKEREKLGIKDNLIRISVGIENVEDLIEDIKSALKMIK